MSRTKVRLNLSLTFNLEAMVLNYNQTLILEYLATFRFLTVGQLMRLGISQDRSHVNKLLRSLRTAEKPLIATTNYGADPVSGKLESIHHLTNFGLKILSERLGNEFPTYDHSGVQAYKDYHHRLGTIDIHIAFHRFCQINEGQLLFWQSYFDRRKGGTVATKLDLPDGKYLIADALTAVAVNGRTNLLAIELYNGQDVTRTLQQLKQHLPAIADCSFGTSVGLEKAHRVMCVFEVPALMKSTLEAVQKEPDFQGLQAHFLFRTLVSVQAGDPPLNIAIAGDGQIIEW